MAAIVLFLGAVTSPMLDQLQGYGLSSVQASVSVGLLYVAIVGLAVRKLFGNTRNLPPGPRPLPLIGNLHNLPKNPRTYMGLAELQKKYGDISTVYFGQQLVICLNSAEVVREAMLKDDITFSSRPSLLPFELLTNYGKDILGSLEYSPRVQVQRKIALGALRRYAHGNALEHHLEQAFSTFQSEVEQNGKFMPFETSYLVSYNILSSMAFGTRFSKDDPVLQKVMSSMRKLEQLAESNVVMLYVATFMKHLPTPFKRTFKQLADTYQSYIAKSYNEHIDTFQKDNLSDFTYHLINALQESQADPNEANKMKLLSDENFFFIIIDLFFAGTETTRQTIAWIWQYLAAFPEVQKRAQQEVDRVIGQDGKVTVNSRDKMPYINAVLHEVMRIRPVTSTGVPRATCKDTTLGGFHIPKGAMVLNITWGVHHDPREWKDPEAFLPERWLDENGRYQFQDNGFIPFGIGRRSCVGEAFAKLEFHMLTAMVLQKYTLKPLTGRTINLEPVPGRVVKAPDQEIMAVRRY